MCEKSEVIKQRLEWFRDLKFGLMMHWGAYSVKGCCESWPLVEEDTWARGMEWGGAEYSQVARQYWNLHKYFNPVKFDPEQWAEYAASAGMKYVVFTTKHHDGFNMYDTRFSDFKVTGPECPFHSDPRADVTKAIFDAFRKRGMGIGAYYSKADWHSPYYWNPNWPHRRRIVNYDRREHPYLWKMYVDFVHGQIKELLTNYGPIDILWLDAGWVRAPREDIDMDGMVQMAREINAELLVVDRECGGAYEDYTTPEQRVPEEVIDAPWESCISMGDSFAFSPYDRYKSTRQLIHLLIDIVTKGGNLLLNIAPQPNGEFPAEAIDRLKDMSEWMKVNGEAIFEARVCAPYRTGKLGFTRKGTDVYLFYLLESDEEMLPAKIEVQLDGQVGSVDLLGSNARLEWEKQDKGLVIQVPDSLREHLQGNPACVFRIAEV